MDLKHLLKRGALLAAANWQTVAIQFVAADDLSGAAGGADHRRGDTRRGAAGRAISRDLLQGSLREIFTTIASTLLSEPVALVAFITAFTLVLLGGSVLMFVVKGGTVDVLVAANAAARPIEREPMTVDDAAQRLALHAPAIHGRLRAPVPAVPGARPALMIVYAIVGGRVSDLRGLRLSRRRRTRI